MTSYRLDPDAPGYRLAEVTKPRPLRWSVIASLICVITGACVTWEYFSGPSVPANGDIQRRMAYYLLGLTPLAVGTTIGVRSLDFAALCAPRPAIVASPWQRAIAFTIAGMGAAWMVTTVCLWFEAMFRDWSAAFHSCVFVWLPSWIAFLIAGRVFRGVAPEPAVTPTRNPPYAIGWAALSGIPSLLTGLEIACGIIDGGSTNYIPGLGLIKLCIASVPFVAGVTIAAKRLYIYELTDRFFDACAAAGGLRVALAVVIVSAGATGSILLISWKWHRLVLIDWRIAYGDLSFYALPAALALWAGVVIVRTARKAPELEPRG